MNLPDIRVQKSNQLYHLRTNELISLSIVVKSVEVSDVKNHGYTNKAIHFPGYVYLISDRCSGHLHLPGIRSSFFKH